MSEKGIIEYISGWEYVSKNRLSFRDIILLLSVAMAFLFSMSFFIIAQFMDLIFVLAYDAIVSLSMLAFLLLARKRQIDSIGWYGLAITGRSLKEDAILRIIRDILRSKGYAVEERKTLLKRHIIPLGTDFSIHAYFSETTALIKIGPENEMNREIMKEIRREIKRRILSMYGK